MSNYSINGKTYTITESEPKQTLCDWVECPFLWSSPSKCEGCVAYMDDEDDITMTKKQAEIFMRAEEILSKGKGESK